MSKRRMIPFLVAVLATLALLITLSYLEHKYPQETGQEEDCYDCVGCSRDR